MPEKRSQQISLHADDGKRLKARELAKGMMDSMRESNADFYARNPDSLVTVTETDYLKGEEELYQIACRHMGIRP